MRYCVTHTHCRHALSPNPPRAKAWNYASDDEEEESGGAAAGRVSLTATTSVSSLSGSMGPPASRAERLAQRRNRELELEEETLFEL